MSHLYDPTTQYYTGEYPEAKTAGARRPGENDACS